MQKYSKYLPSKKFTILTCTILVLASVIFVIFFMSSKEKNFSIREKRQNTALKVENQTLTELIQNDTDGDGIPDWEEALWGTDKNKKITFNDTSDITYINNKKKELKIEQSVNQTKLTETEKFAREFFASYSAMKSSGQVDNNTINSFSNALGQKIVNPNLIDRYSQTDLKINNKNDSATKQKYYATVKILLKSYQSLGIGDELDIVNKELAANSATGLTSNTDQYAKLSVIANAYQDFAKKIITELEVPQTLVPYHLQIANSANNTGISVLNMAKVISDPIVGLSGLSQYRKYSDDLVKAVADLESFLLSR